MRGAASSKTNLYVGIFFGIVLVILFNIHIVIHFKLKSFRSELREIVQTDETRWKSYESEQLKDVREIYNADSGVTAAVTSAHELLRQTSETMKAGKEAVSKLVAQTKELYEGLKNHLLLSHGVQRGVMEPQLTKICLPISITTRGTKWKSLEEILLLTSFLPSLVNTVEPGYHFGVYLGYDKTDPLLDSDEGQKKLKELVSKIVGGAPIEMKSFMYEDSRNRNVWAVNYITRECYLDGYDYFYRVNDDSAFEGKWASVLIPRLQETNNFGVVGTYDKQNPRIFTHSLVGRPHLEVFGYYFPFEFGNYWSDDWITFVYMQPYVHKSYDVKVKHHVHAERYNVEYDRKTLLDEMVNLGRKRWKAYLCLVRKKRDYCTDTTHQDFGNVWEEETAK